MASAAADFDKASIPQALRDALGTMEPVVTVKGLTITSRTALFPSQTVIVANAAVFRYFGLGQQSRRHHRPGPAAHNSLAIDFTRRRIYIGPSGHPS